METLTHPPRASAGLVHTVLGVLATARTWHGEPAPDTFDALLSAVDADDIASLPAALGECLLPLRGDPGRCDLALDVIRAFDLYEAAPGLIAFVRESPTPHGVSTAAAMAAHPGVPPLLAEVTQMAAGWLEDGIDARFGERVQALLTGQVGDEASDATRMLFAERWPGRVRLPQARVPLVVLADDAGRAEDVLRFASELRRAGALIRRVPAGTPKVPDGWLPDWGVAITHSERPAWWPEPRAMLRTDGSLSPASRRDLLRRMRQVLKGDLALRPPREQPLHRTLEDPLLEPAAFFDGAFNVPEVAYLTGWTGRTVRSRGSDYPELRPRVLRRVAYFDFAQLTALRVDHYVARRFGRRPDPEFASALVREARGNEAVPTHVTVDGRVLFERDQAVVDRKGQTAWPEVALSEVVQTFELGSGRAVPELLHPSEHTRVHPSVQRGTPVVAGSRISAIAVRDLVASVRSSGLVGAEANDQVRHYLPELDAAEIADAEAVGLQIRA